MRMPSVIVAALLLAGCAYMSPNHASSLEGCAHRIAKGISKGLEPSYLGVGVLVSTPVDAVTFRSSDLGPALQELMIGALAEEKVNVADIQLRKEPYVSCEQGLIALSRDAGRLRPEIRAEVIVVSTYIASREDITVTARAIDYTTNDVITSTTVVLARTADFDRLLRSGEQVRLLEN